jgi:hypothetical protein
MRKSCKWITLVVALLLTAGIAVAQEQVGSIEGVVSDPQGQPLPGATVEATGPVGKLMATTGMKGEYRFPRLPSGSYTLAARLEGYATVEMSNIDLVVGKTLTVNFTLQFGKFAEAIVVAADQAAIDVKSNANAITLTSDMLDMLPQGTDYTSVVTLAPGAADEPALSGISMNGASGAENRFVVDGVDTTDPFYGTEAQPVRLDFIQELQVKSAGYQAEYGGSLGGVINAITKSGGNEFAGTIRAYYTDSDWGGSQRMNLYEALCPPEGDCHITYNKDDTTRLEPGFQLGGPAVRDKLWFFVAYQPAIVKYKRNPLNTSSTFHEKDTINYFTANLKGNAGPSFLYKITANMSPAKEDGVLPARDGSTPADAPLDIISKYPRESYSAYADWMLSDKFLLTGQASYFGKDSKQSGNVGTTRYYFRNGDICDFGVCSGDPLYEPPGYSNIPNASYFLDTYDKWERYEGKLEASWFFEGAGSHEVKAGVNYQRAKNDVLSGEHGNLFEIRWGLTDRYGLGVIGTYGSVAVRSYQTQGKAVDKNWAFYLQDSWAILDNLTINYGVRAEKEDVPNYGHNQDPTLPEYIAQFNFSDKLAPRVGFAWDVLKDQSLKIYGSYGKYFDIMKLDTARQSFGGDRWITYVYPLDTLDWPSLNAGCSIVDNNPAHNPCPNLGTPATRDLRKPTDPRTGIDPNLHPMEQRQWTLGADYALSTKSILSARYIDNKLLYTIEDIGYLVCSTPTTCEEEYITGNPGHGIVVANTLPGLPPQAPAIRNYKAFELSYNRRFADDWMLTVNYTYSRLRGNYSGLASSDEFSAATLQGRNDPNIERYFDGLVFGYDAKGHLVDGPLATDRPHALQAYGAYRAPWGTMFGLSETWVSGTPITTIAFFNGVDFFPFGRGDQGRTPNVTQTDLFVSHPFKLGGNLQLEINLNVLNAFDQKTVTHVYSYKWRSDICDESPDCDFSNQWYFGQLVPYNPDTYMANADKDPFYKVPDAYQAPRVVRLGLKLSF